MKDTGGNRHNSKAILISSMVGYANKMNADRTHALQLGGIHDDIVAGAVKSAGSEIVYNGDRSLRAIFNSPVNAIECSFRIHEAFQRYNHKSKERDRIRVRIGVHLDEFGSGKGKVSDTCMKVASGIQAMAISGGVCVCKILLDSLPAEFPLDSVGLGRHDLQDVADPVEVFALKTLRLDNGEVTLPVPTNSYQRKKSLSSLSRRSDLKVEKQVGKTYIALLPFRVSSNKPDRFIAGESASSWFIKENDDAYIGEYIAQFFRLTLQYVRQITIIQPGIVHSYVDSELPPDRVAESLNVDYFLRGDYRYLNGRIKIDVELWDRKGRKKVYIEQFQDRDDQLIEILNNIQRTIRLRITAKDKMDHSLPEEEKAISS